MKNISLSDETFDASETSLYHLSLQLSVHRFSYCLLDIQRNKYLGFGTYQIGKVSGYARVCEKAEEVITNNKILQQQYRSTSFSLVHNKATLVPVPLFEESQKLKFFSLNHYLETTDKVSSYTLQNLDSVNLFSIPEPVNVFVKKNFENAHFIHHAGILIENAMLRSKHKKEKEIFVNLNGSLCDIIVTGDNRLIFYNSFICNSKEDFAYYILFTCEQLKLNIAQTGIVLSGEIEKSGEYHNLLIRYTDLVSFVMRNKNFDYSYIFDSVTGHFFYDLLSQYSLERQ